MSASGTLPLEIDIPFWFDHIRAGERSTLDREAMRRVSAVTLMAYRDTAVGTDGTLAIAAAGLDSAAALGKPVRIGQETTCLGLDPTEVKQTFHGQTLTRMNDQLAQVDSGASAYATYAGIAVHDYTAVCRHGSVTVRRTAEGRRSARQAADGKLEPPQVVEVHVDVGLVAPLGRRRGEDRRRRPGARRARPRRPARAAPGR